MKESFLWDAGTYDKVTSNLEEWATTIIKTRKWSGTETVLDAGCGSGRVAKVLSTLTKGMIYAVDSDPNMVKKAMENLSNIKNVVVMQSDILTLDPNTIPIKFNIIFSNAVLHWIDDHRKVFKNFYGLLDKGENENGIGELLIQCGGYGNLKNTISVIDAVKDLSTFKSYFSDWKNPWNFAKPDSTESILRETGYKNIKTHLFSVPVAFKDKDAYLTYLKTVVLGPYLKQIPSEQSRDRFLTEIINQIEKNYPQLMWCLDYIRINILATT